MKIEGLPPDPGGIRKVTEKKLLKSTPAEALQCADTVAITGSSASDRKTELAQSIPVQLPARPEAIEAAADRLAKNHYDTKEARELTAERLITALGITASANPMHTEQSETPERRERIESIQARSTTGYYDRPEALAAVAERLMDSLGLTSLFGK